MIILDEKMPPPPPYAPPAGQMLAPPPPFPPPFPYTTREPPKLDTLPPHLLLRIVYATFTTAASIERQRKTLYWLNMNLRLVNRALYVACMHVLRSTYLQAYTSFIRPPYTSDPFPMNTPTFAPDPSQSPIHSVQRETRVLDLFIALKVREDVWTDESELHLERDESFRDLFDLMQPRSRMEDLVRAYGMREGVVTLGASSMSVGGSVSGSGGGAQVFGNGSANLRAQTNGASNGKPHRVDVRGAPVSPASPMSSVRSKPVSQPSVFTALPFAALSISFSSRRVGLVFMTRERKKTIIEIPRTKDERLENSAKRLVRELKNWLAENIPR